MRSDNLSIDDLNYLQLVKRREEIAYIDDHYFGCRLMVVHIPPSVVDKMAYIGPHFPLPWGNNEDGKPTAILGLLKRDVEAFDLAITDLQNQSAFYKEYLSEKREKNTNADTNANTLLSAIYVDPAIAYDDHSYIHDQFFKNPGKKFITRQN